MCKKLIPAVLLGLLILPPLLPAQNAINWQAADASGAETSMNSLQFLYTSTGQPATGESAGSGRVLHSGYLFIRTVPSGAATLVAQSSIDFGNVIVGQNELRQLTVSNGGTQPLHITATSIAPAVFALISGGGPQTISSGGSVTMTLRFPPSAAGSASGALVIASNAVNAPAHNVSLSGSGVASAPAISLSAVSLDFGQVEIGMNSVRGVTVSNTGNAPLNISGQTVGGANAADFTIIHSSGTPIAPTGSDYIELRFSPSAAGVRMASLTIGSNDPNFPSMVVSRSGSGTSSAQPHISVSQTVMDFGTTSPGTPVERDLVISNTGTASLVLTGQNVSGVSFTLLTPAAGTIAAGGNSTARLRFNPPSNGNHTGSFSISSNDPTAPTTAVSLRGAGGGSTGPRISLGSTVLDFGAVAVLQPKELDLLIRNIGISDLVISSQMIGGADVLHFSISQAAGSPVAPGGGTTLKVRHYPTSPGPKVALLRLLTNDPGMPTAEVALISTVVNAEELPGPAEDAVLLANFPNPFVASTTLAYRMGNPGRVELTVYDTHGRAVALFDEGLREAGTHGLILDASSLSAGVYSVVLKAADSGGRAVIRTMRITCIR